MKVCDFSRSFLTFVTQGRGNNARLQVESVTRLKDKTASKSQTYYFFASCKSEDTFAKENLFYEENYDFCGVFSEEEYILFRTMSTHTSRFREQGRWRDRFEDVKRHIVDVEGCYLERAADVVQSSLANVPMVGQVELTSSDGAYEAQLEFPIKTINANDIDGMYQVDTGPLAFPDFGVDVDNEFERLSPAYVAYNTSDFADFVIQEVTQVGDSGEDSLCVTHYSRLESLKAVTRVVAIG
ncbi:MAG: hypothetical protein CME25_05890 [Gemmatimonadetes bacterium]|nr:hypothetical protein [Gemmatimonadota bacterium]